ncbi:MAG: hypothetical protein ACLFWB_11795 [Armatimonadota bacterium]
MGNQDLDMDKLWSRVDEKIKEGDINLSFWEAIEKAVPICVDDDTLVLGFEPKHMSSAGHLRSGPNEAQLRAAVEEIIGVRPRIEVIEGTTREDWEKTKKRREQSADNMAHARRFDLKHSGAQTAWQDLTREIRKAYYDLPRRTDAMETARFFVRIIPNIADKADEIREQDPEAEELHEQQLNRLFARMGEYTGVPPASIALEYLRYRGSRKKD